MTTRLKAQGLKSKLIEITNECHGGIMRMKIDLILKMACHLPFSIIKFAVRCNRDTLVPQSSCARLSAIDSIMVARLLRAHLLCDRLTLIYIVFHIRITKEAYLDSITLARQVVDIVEEKLASNIVLLDVREQTSIADYFIVATVDTERQARAVEDELRQTLRMEQNIRPLNIEGADNAGSGWVLVDYGDVILHLMTEETRQHYNLEELWDKASVVVKVF